MIASHPPEVLRALGERLRRERYAEIRPWLEATQVEIGAAVHELTRDKVAAAHASGVLEIDRAATAVLLAGAP